MASLRNALAMHPEQEYPVNFGTFIMFLSFQMTDNTTAIFDPDI